MLLIEDRVDKLHDAVATLFAKDDSEIDTSLCSGSRLFKGSYAEAYVIKSILRRLYDTKLLNREYISSLNDSSDTDIRDMLDRMLLTTIATLEDARIEIDNMDESVIHHNVDPAGYTRLLTETRDRENNLATISQTGLLGETLLLLIDPLLMKMEDNLAAVFIKPDGDNEEMVIISFFIDIACAIHSWIKNNSAHDVCTLLRSILIKHTCNKPGTPPKVYIKLNEFNIVEVSSDFSSMTNSYPELVSSDLGEAHVVRALKCEYMRRFNKQIIQKVSGEQ